MNYKKYISSKKWSKKSKEFQKAKGNKCELCDAVSAVCNHLHYKTVGREKQEDVQVLCRDCHNNKYEEKGLEDSMTKRYLNMIRSM